MSYTCLSIVLGIAIIFSGTIGNGISNLYKKRALKVAANNTQGK